MGGRNIAGAGLWVVGLALLLGCVPGYLESYQARHPGWEPALPQPGQGLEEVLAALHRESPVDTIDVEIAGLEVLRADEDPWLVTPFEDIRSGEAPLSPGRDSVVLALLACTYNPGIAPETRTRWAIYLLPAGRLEAWDHATFREDCHATNEFVPARGAAVALERGAMLALRERGGRVQIGLGDTYRRGFAFVEAGRLDEARAMLEAGERLRRRQLLEVRAGRMSPDLLRETQRPREKLMRALGLEPIPLPLPSAPR
jgi:hypothetical protein